MYIVCQVRRPRVCGGTIIIIIIIKIHYSQRSQDNFHYGKFLDRSGIETDTLNMVLLTALAIWALSALF